MRSVNEGVTVEFPCGRWIAEGEGDGNLFCDLTPSADQLLASQVPLDRTTYK